jgi:hypothetical protein
MNAAGHRVAAEAIQRELTRLSDKASVRFCTAPRPQASDTVKMLNHAVTEPRP